MFFINLILIGLAICLGYTILSYIFKIRLTIFAIMVMICIGNVIYLRWGGGGIQHIIPAIIVGLAAGGIACFGFGILYYMFEDKVLEDLDWERPLCFGPERCSRCGSTRIGKSIYFGSSYDHITEDHFCRKCGHYWNYLKD